jgi:phosphoribosylformylglycinamidine cyclo-ligase
MENVPRVLPKGTYLPLRDWAWPAPFLEVQDRTGLAREEMLKTLNCGIGLCLIVDPAHLIACETAAREAGFATFDLGVVSAQPTGGSDRESFVEY